MKQKLYFKGSECYNQNQVLLLILAFFLIFFGLSCRSYQKTTHNSGLQKKLDGCFLCHGHSEAQRGPILDGMSAWYISAQLEKFREGIRGAHDKNKQEMLMAPLAKKLSYREVKEISQAISNMPTRIHQANIKGDVSRGKKVYESCVPCHRADGSGDEKLMSPQLIGLEDWYIYMQLKHFKTGRRGYHKNDISGQAMSAATAHIDEQGLKDVTAYIQKLNEQWLDPE